jgi:hypothetical protein
MDLSTYHPQFIQFLPAAHLAINLPSFLQCVLSSAICHDCKGFLDSRTWIATKLGRGYWNRATSLTYASLREQNK